MDGAWRAARRLNWRHFQYARMRWSVRILLGGVVWMGALGGLTPDRGAGSALLASADAAENTPAVAARDGEAVAGPFAVAPAFLPYVQAHGGANTLGAPLSDDFPLLG